MVASDRDLRPPSLAQGRQHPASRAPNIRLAHENHLIQLE